MNTEVNYLERLYKKIYLSEIDKISDLCGMQWEILDFTTFYSEIEVDQDVWKFYLSRFKDTYVLDIKKNDNSVDSITSNDDSIVGEMYLGVESILVDNPELEKIMNVLSELSNIPSCMDDE